MPDQLTRHWMNDGHARKRKRRGFQVQESLGAEAHPGGKLTKGSGCSRRPSAKGDSVGTYIRQSDKTTEKPGAKSIRLERAWLEEIRLQARATGHRPMIVLGFSPGPGQPTREDWAAFPLQMAKNMTHAMAALLRGDDGEARALARLAMGDEHD